MDYLAEGLQQAVGLMVRRDPDFVGAVWVSLTVASLSITLAAVAGVPCGIALAQTPFPGRGALVTLVHTLMSLPTVLVGLLVYSFLSRRGPLGEMGLLFTPAAMVAGQFILAFPIVTGLVLAAVSGLDRRVRATALSLGADGHQAFRAVVSESRFGVLAALVAGFGRVFAEVGVSMMLGGNIRGYTRTITTTIALETSKGEFGLGIALGLVLLSVSLAVNVLLGLLRRRAG
ncbi:MAG: ABC transporter permease [Candidatus Latescibacterota bacterium]